VALEAELYALILQIRLLAAPNTRLSAVHSASFPAAGVAYVFSVTWLIRIIVRADVNGKHYIRDVMHRMRFNGKLASGL
jgi:hypothetical protein